MSFYTFHYLTTISAVVHIILLLCGSAQIADMIIIVVVVDVAYHTLLLAVFISLEDVCYKDMYQLCFSTTAVREAYLSVAECCFV